MLEALTRRTRRGSLLPAAEPAVRSTCVGRGRRADVESIPPASRRSTPSTTPCPSRAVIWRGRADRRDRLL